MMANLKNFDCYSNSLVVSTVGNAERTVLLIRIQMLGCKGLK